jgi:hypothetical protein
LFVRASVSLGQEETMQFMEMETENAHHRQALLEEAQHARLPEQVGVNRLRFPLRMLLLTVGAILALGLRFKEWGEGLASQGFLPNVNID